MTLRQTWRETLAYAGPIALGLFVALLGIAPWVAMASLNAGFHPEIPLAALGTLAWLFVYLAWLNGGGPPKTWQAARRYRLRLWQPGSNGWSKDGISATLSLMAVIGLLAFIWILIGAPERPPDLSRYPSTAYLVSIVVMGALVSGVVEEAAYRGYMQRGLERFGAGTAIVIQAFVFALVHGVHGLETLLFLGPGIFIAGIVYGLLAYHSGSIVPGMIVHFLGDLAFTYFATLGGDWRLLIVA
ncbi:lysostaphin resistance A-like protein [Sphingosinicella sp.]|uniref:lysostaphin resistance A-like protein n=1 Tax=Sphingosinicella sp. TaxID=1917971 RepID=UPI004037DBAA